MDSATWGFIGVIAGSFIGALTSIGTTVINSKNTSRLQKNANRLERQERARAFQRENLLALQDALQDSMRIMAQAHIHDKKEHAKSGKWGKAELDDNLDQKILNSFRTLSILTERISDDELRAELKSFRARLSGTYHVKTMTEAVEIVNELSSLFPTMMEEIGTALRSNY